LHRLVFSFRHRLLRHFLLRKFGRLLVPVLLLARRVLQRAAPLALRSRRRLSNHRLPL